MNYRRDLIAKGTLTPLGVSLGLTVYLLGFFRLPWVFDEGNRRDTVLGVRTLRLKGSKTGVGSIFRETVEFMSRGLRTGAAIGGAR